MDRPLLFDACVVIDFAECEIDVVGLAAQALGPVHVVETALAEIRSVRIDLNSITVIEPEFEVLEQAARGGRGLSFADWATLPVARRASLTVVTSDRALRRACVEGNVAVVWSLEILLQPVSVGALDVASAAQIAQSIHVRNPWHVNGAVLTSFLEKLELGQRPTSKRAALD